MSILQRIKRLNPVSHSLHLVGVGTTLASVAGSYQYLLVETHDQMMSAAFAAGLAVCIYAGWEFAFNSKILHRRLLAATLAAAAASISGYTVYQHNQHIAQQAADAALQTQLAQAANASQQQRKTLQTQADALQTTIDDLRRQSATDQKQMDNLDGKNKEWQSSVIRKSIAERNNKIDNYTQQKADLIKQINQLTESKKAEGKPVGFNPASLIRASMFEGMTVLCLLFASWTRQEKQASESKQIAAIEGVTIKASAALASLEMALANAQDAKQTALADLNQAAQTLIGETQQQLEQSAQRINTATAELLDIKKAAISDLATYSERLRTETEQAALLQHTLSKTATDAVAVYKNAENVISILNENVQNANQLQTALANLSNIAEQKQSDLANLTQAANEANSQLENTHVTAIRTLSNLHMQIDTAQNCKSPFAPAFAPANQGVQISGAEQEGKFNKADLIFALKNHLIETNDRNRLPVDYLKNKTGLGKPSIQEALEESAKAGVLINTGNGYTYATEPQAASPLVHSNVISLRGK